jgi:hypothetical protein
MTVAQLIAVLQELPQDKEVVITNWEQARFEVILEARYIEDYDHVSFASE